MCKKNHKNVIYIYILQFCKPKLKTYFVKVIKNHENHKYYDKLLLKIPYLSCNNTYDAMHREDKSIFGSLIDNFFIFEISEQ